jgi:FkbM family methyltransferase
LLDFFTGTYDDEKRSALLSFLRPSGVALDVGANIGFYTVPMAIRAKEIGSHVIAVEPVASNAQWLRYNLALNGCLDVTQVLEVALGNECGQVEIVLADDSEGGEQKRCQKQNRKSNDYPWPKRLPR